MLADGDSSRRAETEIMVAPARNTGTGEKEGERERERETEPERENAVKGTRGTFPCSASSTLSLLLRDSMFIVLYLAGRSLSH